MLKFLRRNKIKDFSDITDEATIIDDIEDYKLAYNDAYENLNNLLINAFLVQ